MEQREKRIKYRGRQAVPAQYRRKRSWKKPLLILGGVLVACAIAAAIILPRVLNRNEENGSVQAPAAPDQVIHLVAGGDIQITDKSVAAGQTAGGYDYTSVFQDILPVLSSADVTMLNYEGVLGGTDYGTATKVAPAELLTALKNAGVDVLQTANSYSVFGGHLGMVSTIKGVQNAGITPLGTYETKAEFDKAGGYVIWEINGIKIAMMAFTKGMAENGGIPEISKGCFGLLYKDYDNKDYETTYQKVDEEGITKVVRNAAAHKPDVMVAMVHWGSEFNDRISKTQEKICKILQDEGVDVILGSHPRYVNKVEFDQDKGSVVAWSLGDFYGEGEDSDTRYSVLLNLEITKNATTGETKVTGCEYTPIYLEKGEDGSLRLLRIREAMEAYENSYLGRVSEATYNAMASALKKIQNRIGLK